MTKIWDLAEMLPICHLSTRLRCQWNRTLTVLELIEAFPYHRYSWFFFYSTHFLFQNMNLTILFETKVSIVPLPTQLLSQHISNLFQISNPHTMRYKDPSLRQTSVLTQLWGMLKRQVTIKIRDRRRTFSVNIVLCVGILSLQIHNNNIYNINKKEHHLQI